MIASSSAVAQQPSGAAASAASANAAPRLVNYYGTLNIASGKPVASVGLTFLLYKDSQGGAPLWTETQKVTPDKNGHYIVQLGSTRSEGLPAEIFVSGATRWLAVQVAGEAEQPRVLLVTVPYARTADPGKPVAPSTLVLPVPESGNVAGGAVNAIPLLAAAGNIQSSVYGFGGPLASTATVAATPQTAGLSGISDVQGGVGVWGQDNLGTGVYGTGSVGFGTDSNAQQSRTAGGWAKALVWFTPQYNGYITYCYNSTLMGKAATTPPCGFTWDKTGTGDYIIDLGFEVDDRFFSIAGANMSYNVAVCSRALGFVVCTHSLTSTQVEITSFDPGAHHFADANTVLYLIVY